MKQVNRTWTICVAIVAVACFSSWAQGPPTEAFETAHLQLLIVDATKTFASTIRVGALASAIRSTGVFDLSVCLTDHEEIYGDPMTAATERPAGIYDVVIILPRGLDDETADVVWIVTEVLPWTSPEGWQLVTLLSGLIDGVFAGTATAVDPTEGLFPILLASTYRMHGWLQ